MPKVTWFVYKNVVMLLCNEIVYMYVCKFVFHNVIIISLCVCAHVSCTPTKTMTWKTINRDLVNLFIVIHVIVFVDVHDTWTCTFMNIIEKKYKFYIGFIVINDSISYHIYYSKYII